ncbi:RNA-directed DNA polymerase from mobile element jockey [Apostichopus japonicus]|uniref:RNA-directed DNA polymerase from mobile element jockey n=1 Tax=Stichopus japonicus TaxID=307972 RepID=A0A2G8JW64_STIJA|nr:RNA-directed DNA polymerase from mobile element jockey [Apostichopus japonicus]
MDNSSTKYSTIFQLSTLHAATNSKGEGDTPPLRPFPRTQVNNQVLLLEPPLQNPAYGPAHITEITIGATKVAARYTGAVLDSELGMIPHVNSVVRMCYSHLRQISHIRPLLTRDATATLVNAIVTYRLDYVNSLLFGLPNSTTRKLELVQNNVARIVCKKRKRDHVTPLLDHCIGYQYIFE